MEWAATRDAYGKALIELGEKYKEVVVLDSDVSASTRTYLFKEKYPSRFFNFGVAEANMIGFAAGLALCGKIPFASSFAIFAAGRAYEQIRVAVAWPNLNVKIIVTHAGISVGEDGASHQSIEDIALMRILPNMKVVVPADIVEAEKAILEAVNIPGPVFIRLGRPKVPVIYKKDKPFSFGKADVLMEGEDVVIIACGIMVSESLKAAETLKKEGISATVLNVSTIKPIDKTSILHYANNTRAVIVAEEHSIYGGLGSAVAELLAENSYPVVMKRIGIEDKFGVSGEYLELLDYFRISEKYISSSAIELVEKKSKLI